MNDTTKPPEKPQVPWKVKPPRLDKALDIGLLDSRVLKKCREWVWHEGKNSEGHDHHYQDKRDHAQDTPDYVISHVGEDSF
jgi:hypothetical protein